jgi:hypothetical protein
VVINQISIIHDNISSQVAAKRRHGFGPMDEYIHQPFYSMVDELKTRPNYILGANNPLGETARSMKRRAMHIHRCNYYHLPSDFQPNFNHP